MLTVGARLRGWHQMLTLHWRDIETAAIQDAGEYACKAENVFGTAKKSVNVTVLRKTTIEAPGAETKIAPEKSATLECIFETDPLLAGSVEVKWIKGRDGETILGTSPQLLLENASEVQIVNHMLLDLFVLIILSFLPSLTGHKWQVQMRGQDLAGRGGAGVRRGGGAGANHQAISRGAVRPRRKFRQRELRGGRDPAPRGRLVRGRVLQAPGHRPRGDRSGMRL